MPPKAPTRPRDVITLADLAPRQRVVGGGERRVGNERRVFGSGAPAKRPAGTSAAKVPKDQSAGRDLKAGKKAR